MKENERVAALKRITILKDLSEASFEYLARACNFHTAAPRQSIISVNDKSSDVYFIVRGKVRAGLYAANGTTVIFVKMSAGDMFGEIAAIDGQPRSATIEAEEHCTLASLSAREFEGLIMREPAFGLVLLRKLACHVRRLSERVFEYSTLAVPCRVRAELLRLAYLAGAERGEVTLSPAPALIEIAARVATHREAVSRELSALADLGLIQREHGNLRILDVARLAELVRENRGEAAV